MLGMMGAMMVLMVIGILIFLVVLVGAIWFLLRWLNQRQTPPLSESAPPQNLYQRYEQGYQSPQPMSDTSREGGPYDRSPQPKQQYDQPSIPYPQEQELPPQS